jgi:nucleoside 2-deoxyribosyltransferase
VNIYFSCSITGGRNDQVVYKLIVDHLLARGHTVPTAQLASPNVPTVESAVDPRQVYERDVNWVKACDAMIAEVSTPSHGVGYEIALALSLGKSVLCCHAVDRRVSKMISGNSHPKIRVVAYKDGIRLLEEIDSFIADCSS